MYAEDLKKSCALIGCKISALPTKNEKTYAIPINPEIPFVLSYFASGLCQSTNLLLSIILHNYEQVTHSANISPILFLVDMNDEILLCANTFGFTSRRI